MRTLGPLHRRAHTQQTPLQFWGVHRLPLKPVQNLVQHSHFADEELKAQRGHHLQVCGPTGTRVGPLETYSRACSNTFPTAVCLRLSQAEPLEGETVFN